MHADILKFNLDQGTEHSALCELLAEEIDKALLNASSKIWHGHPVWFLDENPIVGYSKQKPGIRLMFWSGADFEEEKLNVLGREIQGCVGLLQWCVRGAETRFAEMAEKGTTHSMGLQKHSPTKRSAR